MMTSTPKITNEEIAIIKKAQAGSKSAFNELYDKYKGFVVNLLNLYIKDLDEARDIANIVFIKVHKKLSQFSEYSSFGGWLRIIARNTAVDYIRSTKSKMLKNTTLDSADYRQYLAESQLSTEDDIVNHLDYDKLIERFDSLPKLTKKICLMHYANDMTVVQIAEALNIPTGTVKSKLFRTRNKIKQFLK